MTSAPCDPLASLHEPVVRDLAWALCSPPLLSLATDTSGGSSSLSYPELCADFIPQLETLDNQPATLHDAVLAQRSGRLGLYFEALWQFWLTHNQDYALRAHNVQIHIDGVTHGELDLIVQDQRSGRFQHWELAVKFYLGIGDTQSTCAWVGPNTKDRLDKKLLHLRNRQLPLLQHPETQSQLAEAGWEVQQQRLILKGRLFYPLRQTAPGPTEVAVNHLRGWWASHEDFIAHFQTENLQWRPLSRQHWLAPLRRESQEQLHTPMQLLDLVKTRPQHPLCVAGFATGDECSRGFIVPPHWPH